MDKHRRAFFKQSIAAVASVTVAQLVTDRSAFAADMPHVDETGAQATGLGYVHDATKVDKAKYARYQAGMTCAGCALYQGTPDSEWAGCGIFAGQAVAGKGWCSAFAPKA
jgi:High potential iron-sulfur protein